MTAAAMAQMGYSTHRPHGWLASILVHVLAVAVSMFMFAELKPASRQETFRWEIALAQVTPPPQVDPPAPAQPRPAVPPPPPAPPKPVEAKPVVQRVQTVQTVQKVEQVVHREQVPVQKVSPVVESIAQHAEPVQQVRQAIETEVVQPTESRQTPEVVEKTAAIESALVETVAAPAPVNQPAPMTQVVQAEPTPVVSESTTQRAAPVTSTEQVVAQTPAPAQQTPQAPVQQTAQVAAAQPQAIERPAMVTSQTKADYSWLTQELLSRLEGSKRYPYAARMNRWEGRVVVRAVVRDDGQVVSLQIAESSGHAILDNDAMELIRKISPLHLKHPLRQSQVALLVPVGYALR